MTCTCRGGDHPDAGASMRLIRFAVVLIVGLFVAPLVVEAQSAGKIARIGYIFVSPPISPSPLRIAFIQGLQDFGWIEGFNLAIESSSGNGTPGRPPPLLADLLMDGADVIFGFVPFSAATARHATPEVSLCFVGVLDS